MYTYIQSTTYCNGGAVTGGTFSVSGTVVAVHTDYKTSEILSLHITITHCGRNVLPVISRGIFSRSIDSGLKY